MKSGIARELRENAGYLLEGGWRSTAFLMEAAAVEIERLSARVAELERRETRKAEAAPPWSLARLFSR